MRAMIETIGIVGAGTMGNGIAQVCAAAGLPVVMTDISDAALTRGMSVVSNSLERLVNKQKMTEADRQAALARITTSTDTAKFSTCDLVIEAATENEDLKVKILRDLCAKLQPRALLATNTSSISITKLAAATDRPDRFIGLHFFNPVPLMALLELIRGLQTSDDTHAKAEAFAKRIGKVSITAKNSPGFADNRILCPMINEAIFALQEDIATAEDLDAGMKLGCNHPTQLLRIGLRNPLRRILEFPRARELHRIAERAGDVDRLFLKLPVLIERPVRGGVGLHVADIALSFGGAAR